MIRPGVRVKGTVEPVAQDNAACYQCCLVEHDRDFGRCDQIKRDQQEHSDHGPEGQAWNPGPADAQASAQAGAKVVHWRTSLVGFRVARMSARERAATAGLPRELTGARSCLEGWFDREEQSRATWRWCTASREMTYVRHSFGQSSISFLRATAQRSSMTRWAYSADLGSYSNMVESARRCGPG